MEYAVSFSTYVETYHFSTFILPGPNYSCFHGRLLLLLLLLRNMTLVIFQLSAQTFASMEGGDEVGRANLKNFSRATEGFKRIAAYEAGAAANGGGARTNSKGNATKNEDPRTSRAKQRVEAAANRQVRAAVGFASSSPGTSGGRSSYVGHDSKRPARLQTRNFTKPQTTAKNGSSGSPHKCECKGNTPPRRAGMLGVSTEDAERFESELLGFLTSP